MKFGRKFEQSKIPEWADFYVSYKLLKKLLSPYKALKKAYLSATLNRDNVSIHNFTVEDIEKLESFAKAFETIIFEDLEKVLIFYTQELSQTIAKWKKLGINLLIFKQKRDILKNEVKEAQFSMLKESFQVLIQELKLLNDYLTNNLDAFQKIIKKQYKAVKSFGLKADLKVRFEKSLVETKVFIMRERLNNFLFAVENEYISFFYKNKNDGINQLRKISQGQLISKNETFWFGLFSGFAFLLVIVIVVLWWNGGLDVDEDEVFKEIFPIFRGIGLIILYFFLLAWNVYGWTKYNVNYKLIFRFNYHYSQFSQILKRAAVFSTIMLVLLIWYLIVEEGEGDFAKAIDFVPPEIIPMFLWLSFALYIFFPSKKIFNWPGRLYLFRLTKNILKTPFIPIIFPIIFATDQLASFVLPLKDLEYTICYYIAYFFNDETALHQCQSNKRFTKSVIMAIIPLVWRILQCLRQVYDKPAAKRDPLINFGKYACSLLVSILSYLAVLHNNGTSFLIPWIIFAAISTVYSYYWDLKKDWGFLQPNAKYRFLRNELSYNNPVLYYIAIVVNLVMRSAWVLSISPDVISQIMRPELFSFLIGLVEIIRRSVWNFLRVEKEHIANVGNFRVVQDMKLPYNDISYDDSIEEALFTKDLENIMENNSKMGKPISNANTIPYRTSIVNIAEKFYQLRRKNIIAGRRFSLNGDESSKLKNFSELPFKAAALAAMKDNEREEIQKELIKYREEEATKVRMWEKEVSQFKLLVKKKANKFEIISIEKEPKIFQQIRFAYSTKEENKNIKQKGHINLNVIEESPEKLKSDLHLLLQGDSDLCTSQIQETEVLKDDLKFNSLRIPVEICNKIYLSTKDSDEVVTEIVQHQLTPFETAEEEQKNDYQPSISSDPDKTDSNN